MDEHDHKIYWLQGLLYKLGVPVYAVGGLVFVLSFVTFAVKKFRKRRAVNRNNVEGENGGGNGGSLSFPLLAEPGDFDVEINTQDLPPPNAPTNGSNSARRSNASTNATNNNVSTNNAPTNSRQSNATTNAQGSERGGASNPHPSPSSAGPSNSEAVQNPTYGAVSHSFTVTGEPSTSNSLYAAGRQPPLPPKPSTSKDNGWNTCTLQVPEKTPKPPPCSLKKKSENVSKSNASIQTPPPTADKSTQSPTFSTAEVESQTNVKELASPIPQVQPRHTTPNITARPPLLPRSIDMSNVVSPSPATSTPTVQNLPSPATPFRNMDGTGSPKTSDWQELYLTSLSRLENITTEHINQSHDSEISMGNSSTRHQHSQDDTVEEQEVSNNNTADNTADITTDNEISIGKSSRRHDHSQDDTVPEEEVSDAGVGVGNTSNLDASAAATPQQSASQANTSQSNALHANASADHGSFLLAFSPSLFNDSVGASNIDQSLQVSIEMSDLE